MGEFYPVFSLNSSDLCDQIYISIVHFLWQGVFIGVLCEALLRFARGRSANVRYGIALAALLLCPACFVATLVWTSPVTSQTIIEHSDSAGLQFGDSPALAATQASAGSEKSHGQNLQVIESDGIASPMSNGATGQEAAIAHRSTSKISYVLTTFYLAGVVLFLLRLGTGLWGGSRLRQASQPVTDSTLLDVLHQEVRRLGIKAVPVLATCERVVVPTVVGLFKPMILLPASVSTGFSTTEVSAILSHELAHICRFDLWLNLIQRIVEALLFFHPVVWLISRRVSSEREICCDDLAVTSGHERVSYAGALLRMSEICVGESSPSTATLAATGTTNALLEYRIFRLLSLHPVPKGMVSVAQVSRKQSLAAFVCCLVALVGLTAIPAPPSYRTNATQDSSEQPSNLAPLAMEDDDRDGASAPAAVAISTKAALNTERRTEKISISGTAFAPDGDVVAGASVFAISTNGRVKLGETKTDRAGRYSFTDLPLPISGQESSEFDGDHFGKFVVYGLSPQHGLTWRSERRYFPDAEPHSNELVDPGSLSDLRSKQAVLLNSPSQYFKDDKIRLHLSFRKPTPFRLRVVDDRQLPVSEARVELRYLQPVAGATTELIDSQVFVNGLGFAGFGDQRLMSKSLFARQADEDGWVEFPHLPDDSEFRIEVEADGFAERREMATTGNVVPLGEVAGTERYRTGETIVLPTTVAMEVTVVYGDTNEPAKDVCVFGESSEGLGNRYGVTDKNGKAVLNLVSGENSFSVWPVYGTPYQLVDFGELSRTVSDAENQLVVRLQRAVEVEFRIVDAANGSPVKSAAVWHLDRPDHRPQIHRWRSFRLPNIVMQSPADSDESGILRTYFKPGKHVLGFGEHRGYRVPNFDESDGIELDFAAGAKYIITLKQHSDGTVEVVDSKQEE